MNFKIGDVAAYRPSHVKNLTSTTGLEKGVVSSISDDGNYVRVKFFNSLSEYGQSCSPRDLIMVQPA